MTASIITSPFTAGTNKDYNSAADLRTKFFTLHFYAFDGDFYENEVEASNEDEAYDMAIELAAELPEAIDYICVYTPY